MISYFILILSGVLLLLFHNRLYTVVTFGLLLFFMLVLVGVTKSKWLNQFYIAYVVSLVPFYLVNGFLTSIPVVLYNDHQNTGLRIGTIPFEDHFYSMTLLLMNIAFFEYFKNRKKLSE
nr:lycopene cyclase domain-containing protein [Mucilaginibacter segetis]